ncbi:HWE histidine kinase domain-containing protein [Rhizobium sp. S152]|uniref:HWE histidine kinase domain-containing protein n=1 Tax=Rhizobium sp. S152 TaxID=3055038 RepID=UPI0025A9D7B7|nr:GAF domain-containing protein [Rhizobium sp. S152]MDM9625204.1 HWE histidine kinase domain-containing protein [Rhizobium sp. S152]
MDSMNIALNDNLPFEEARAYERLQDRELWLSGQRQAFASALNDAPLKETLGILVDTATSALGDGTRAAFFLTGPDGETLHHVVGMPDDYAIAVDGLAVGPESLACGLAAHIGKAVLTADVYLDPLWRQWIWLADKYQYRACWSYPINTSTGHFVGTFSVYWPEPREAATCDIDRTGLITQAAGVIISRFNEAEERRKAEHALLETKKQLEAELADSELLRQISLELAGEDGEDGLYKKLVGAAAKIMKSDVCTVQYLHPERGPAGELEMLASTGLDARGVEYWKWVRGDSGCTCGEVLRTGKRAIAEDVETCSFMAGTPDRDVLLGGGIRAGQTTPLVTREGKLVGMISTHWSMPHKPTERELRMLDIIARSAADLIERRRAAATQRLLLNELNHRVKNTLAVVQAMATRTLARSPDPKVFAKSFGGRVQSLAKIHDLLSAKAWEGADLKELIYGQVSAGAPDETRLTATGPAVRLDPQTALHLALVVHELGTNATKYGALSLPTGKVSIQWRIDEGLRIRWAELGGPRVEPAASPGFGTTLISQSVRGQGGEAKMTALPEGVIWDIMVPYTVKASAAKLLSTMTKEKPAASMEALDLKGRRILVVEDEPLIGMDIVAALEDAGAEVEGPVATVEEACAVIESKGFDAALVDANLHGTSVGPIAAALAERGVPFAFATGYDKDGLPEGFQNRLILGKPAGPEDVLKTVGSLIAKSDRIEMNA